MNLDRMKALVERALPHRRDYELAFFSFCNHIEQSYKECFRDFLTQRMEHHDTTIGNGAERQTG